MDVFLPGLAGSSSGLAGSSSGLAGSSVLDRLALLFCFSELIRSSVLLAVVIGTLVMELARRRSCGASWQLRRWAVGVKLRSQRRR
jgi:hypothetical protein